MKQAFNIQIEPKFQEQRLTRRLRNWGLWLNHEKHVGPNNPRCNAIEANYLQDALGDVMEDEDRRPPKEMPDTVDAEAIQRLVSRLDSIEQYSLALTYGGTPCVMRWRRLGDFAMRRALDNAHILLHEMIRAK